MNTISAFSVAALFAGALFFGNAKQPVTNFSNHTTAAADTSIKKINLASKKDPVCGMSVEHRYADTATHNNKVYGFCSKMCKSDFVKDPKKYIKN